MDAEEAEGNGREYLERWPRDRVIFGSIHPYRPPLPSSQPRHSGSVAMDGTRGNPRSQLDFNFKQRPSISAFRPRRASS